MNISFGSFFDSPAKVKAEKAGKEFQGVKHQDIEDTFLKASRQNCANKTQRAWPSGSNGC